MNISYAYVETDFDNQVRDLSTLTFYLETTKIGHLATF